jgi:ATP-dependent RNA circularization protein (DNA/RNA ligase family)
MIDLILKTNGYDVRVLCRPGEDVTVNTAGKILELTTRLIEELWVYGTVDISIKTIEDQGDSNPPVPYVPDELFKVHEDNMMRVYNEQRTIS